MKLFISTNKPTLKDGTEFVYLVCWGIKKQPVYEETTLCTFKITTIVK